MTSISLTFGDDGKSDGMVIKALYSNARADSDPNAHRSVHRKISTLFRSLRRERCDPEKSSRSYVRAAIACNRR
jgi:hypothetical protein